MDSDRNFIDSINQGVDIWVIKHCEMGEAFIRVPRTRLLYLTEVFLWTLAWLEVWRLSNRGETRPDLLLRILFENDRDRDRRFIGSDLTNRLIGSGKLSPYKTVIRRRRNLIHQSNARLNLIYRRSLLPVRSYPDQELADC